ncbi:MAG: hypothetical protein HPY44_14235 [Armatimonadetes bacterium]|nr:hypothetical protein [Armatimonadota bacterium]
MRYIMLCITVFAVLLGGHAVWALSENDQAGMDKLLADTVTSLTTGEPALWNLFSSQGSAAIIGTADSFTAASRSKLKSNADLAAAFRLPEGTKIASANLSRLGEFVAGRLKLTFETTPPPPPPVVEPPSLGDVWDAFMPPQMSRFVVREAPAACEPEPPAPIVQTWDVCVSAVQDGPQRSFRYVSLTITPEAKTTDQAAVGAVVDTLRSWERSMLQGDVTELAQGLYSDPFVVGAYTPDGQAWFFTYPEYLTTMLATALSMGSAERSAMLDLDTVVSGPVASTIGKWSVDIPMFGHMTMGMTGSFVNEDGRWLMVSLCGGLLED